MLWKALSEIVLTWFTMVGAVTVSFVLADIITKREKK